MQDDSAAGSVVLSHCSALRKMSWRRYLTTGCSQFYSHCFPGTGVALPALRCEKDHLFTKLAVTMRVEGSVYSPPDSSECLRIFTLARWATASSNGENVEHFFPLPGVSTNSGPRTQRRSCANNGQYDHSDNQNRTARR